MSKGKGKPTLAKAAPPPTPAERRKEIFAPDTIAGEDDGTHVIDEPDPEDDDKEGVLSDAAQFAGVTGPTVDPPRPRFSSLDDAVEQLDQHFRTSHGLSIDKALIQEFVIYYRGPR